MIKFEGIVNRSTKLFLIKKLFFGVLIADIIFFLILGIPAILIAINKNSFIFLMAVCGGIIFSIIFAFFMISYNLPNNIYINNTSIFAKYKEAEKSAQLNNIIKIVDYGNFYFVKFYNFEKWGNCVCQKDLIVEGTIEEFEKLFEDKIIRKIKSK